MVCIGGYAYNGFVWFRQCQNRKSNFDWMEKQRNGVGIEARIYELIYFVPFLNQANHLGKQQMVGSDDDVERWSRFKFMLDSFNPTRKGLKRSSPIGIWLVWMWLGNDGAAVVHGANGRPFPTSEFEHSSIPATVKLLFNLTSPFLTKRDEWAATFDSILRTRSDPRTDCPGWLPPPPFFIFHPHSHYLHLRQLLLDQLHLIMTYL